MITLDTLIAVLVANNQLDILTKALLVDSNNNHLSYQLEDRLIVPVPKALAVRYLPRGHKFKEDSYRYNLSCPIVRLNPLALTNMYGVDIGFDNPNIIWVGGNSADSESTMILTPEAEAAIAQVKVSIGEPS